MLEEQYLPLEKNQITLEEKLVLPTTNEALRTEEVNVVMESQEPTELVATHTTVTLINPRERKAMLEQQYYALMRHAEQNSTNFENQLGTNNSFHPLPFRE